MVAAAVSRFWAPAATWITPPLPLYGDDHERRDFAPVASWTPPPRWPPWSSSAPHAAA